MRRANNRKGADRYLGADFDAGAIAHVENAVPPEFQDSFKAQILHAVNRGTGLQQNEPAKRQVGGQCKEPAKEPENDLQAFQQCINFFASL